MQSGFEVLLIGDTDAGEFRSAADQLQRETRLTCAVSVDSAFGLVDAPYPWQIVVFAQLRPGQFAIHDIDRVHRAMPLARLVALLGSWCEGEMRSGHPWPGVWRIYWHQWPQWWREHLAAATAMPTAWQLPRTASPVEHALSGLSGQPAGMDGTVAIVTARASFTDALAAACRSVGLDTLRWVPLSAAAAPPADVILWEPCAVRGIGWSQLRDIRAAAPDLPVIALMNFPRCDQVETALALGAVDVVSCPFQLPALWTALRSALAGGATPPEDMSHGGTETG